MEKILDFSSERILTFGRTVKKDGTLYLSWTGSGFSFRFEGTELRIKFGEFNSERHFYFKISVDNKTETHCVCASDQIIIVRGLSPKPHNVKVTKITECISPVLVKSITISGSVANFSEPEPLPDFRIEFVGDSLTAGFGNMSEPDAGIYRASEQDITYSYSFEIASFLKADGRYICCSGKGVFNNWDGSKENRITDFYDKIAIGEQTYHDFTSWRPHAVFINAGTNDITAGTDPKDFKNAYIDLVLKIHQNNPEALIICLYGMTTNKFNDVFSEISNVLKGHPYKSHLKVEFIKLKTLTPEHYGALGHPNAEYHNHIARTLLKTAKRTIPR